MTEEISATAGGEKKKKLYVFFFQGTCQPFRHVLYALDVPNPDDPNPCEIPPPSPVEPFLQFNSSESPFFMACINLGSKLYFIGGHHHQIASPSSVWTLDLTTTPVVDPAFRDHPFAVLKQGPPMNSGKFRPFAFVAKGKIFIICRKYFHRFEVFDPDTDTWETLPSPPFRCCLVLYHVIVDDTVIFNVVLEKKHFCYDLNTNIWTEYDQTVWTKYSKHEEFEVGNACYYLDDTMYCSDIIDGVLPIKRVNRKEECPSEEEQVFDPANSIKFIKPGRVVDLALTHMGNRRFCYLQVGKVKPDPHDPNLREVVMSLTLFDVDEGDKAKYLNSAYYVCGNPLRSWFRLKSAFMV